MRPALLIVTFIAVLAGVLFTLNSSPRSSLAQTEAPITQEQLGATDPDPPGTIDGAKNPELIPDELAYEMFFIAVAEPEGATAEDLARARSKLAQTLLDEDDTAALLTALTDFRKQSDRITAELAEINLRSPIAPPTSPDGLRIAELHRRSKQVTRDTVGLLAARLSQDGANKVHEHLQREKRGMKMYPTE